MRGAFHGGAFRVNLPVISHTSSSRMRVSKIGPRAPPSRARTPFFEDLADFWYFRLRGRRARESSRKKKKKRGGISNFRFFCRFPGKCRFWQKKQQKKTGPPPSSFFFFFRELSRPGRQNWENWKNGPGVPPWSLWRACWAPEPI